MAWKRPTIDTPYHIDWNWWSENDQNYRLFLYEQLCEDCRRRFPSAMDVEEVDWIDPETAEVTRADGLLMCLRLRCVDDPDFINATLPLASAVFRVFLLNGNQPLSPNALHDYITWRPAETILRLIGGRQVHYGIRPAGI